jgi:glutathione S-transferase
VRVYRIPLSTNVERVALALGYKDLAVEWVDVDPRDRTVVREVSGQELVPVLVSDEGQVVHDSTRILEWLESVYPDPPLYPRDPARRVEVEVVVDWFNRVWKRPPNELEAELSKPDPDRELVARLGGEITGSLAVFEALLTGREYLMGEFSVADCAAFPFLRFALFHDPDDPYLFHAILVERLALDGGYPNVRAWLERMEARPRT